MQTLSFKNMTLTWLDSTIAIKDSGPVMGPVSKAVWTQCYPCDDNYNIQTNFNPILIEYQNKLILIDTGWSTNKLSDKKIRNLGIQYPSRQIDNLKNLGYTPEDIDIILMTHMHDDHANGLTDIDELNNYYSVYPKATIYMTAIEWHNVQNPNLRTAGTYLQENWRPIANQVQTFTDYLEVLPGIELYHAKGHSEGMAVIKLTQENEVMFHFSDLQQVTANILNPLWISGFDDYPMDSVATREYWLPIIKENQYTLFFYHDPYLATIQFNQEGKVINYTEKTGFKHYIPMTDKIKRPY